MVKVGDIVIYLDTGDRFTVTEIVDLDVYANSLRTGGRYYLRHGEYEVVKENLTTEAEDVKHSHYYVDLSKYIKDGKCIVDVYKILAAYKVVHPELQHLGKKVLCLGQRGLKDELTDAENILDSAESFVERLKLEIAYENKGA